MREYYISYIYTLLTLLNTLLYIAAYCQNIAKTLLIQSCKAAMKVQCYLIMFIIYFHTSYIVINLAQLYMIRIIVRLGNKYLDTLWEDPKMEGIANFHIFE